MKGLVQCSDCHNPRGGFLTRQLRATAAQDTVCYKCHADKAGPFVFEHEAVKIEGCVACHTPHGSSNPRLLKRSQVNLVCLECHAFTVDSVPSATPTFPVYRAHLGANLTGTSGSAILPDPNAVPGPLNSKWLRPYAGFDYRFGRNWTRKAYWGYYGYQEDLTALPQDVFTPRNFDANTATLSLRCAF